MQATKHKNCFDKKDLGIELNNKTSLILSVDNDRDNLLLTSLVLSSFYYIVVMTAKTQTALSMAKSYQPDLILLGINFPGVKESEICYQLKQEKQTCHIPILALTALTETDYLDYFLCLGCDYCLSKPYLLEDLHKIIQERYQL